MKNWIYRYEMIINEKGLVKIVSNENAWNPVDL